MEVDADYDQHVRELAFDQRARAKDRTKTKEELAVEAKEALEKAERRRLKRMLGEDDNSDTERRRKRQRGGDDLDDDFTAGMDWDALGEGLTTGDLGEDAESLVDSASGQESDDAEDEEASGDSESGIASELDDGESEGEEGEQANLTSARRPLKLGKALPSTELPFTFSCPATHEQFLEITEGINDADVPTVVQRIRTIHHPSLAEDNTFKLQVELFFITLLLARLTLLIRC